MDACAYTTGMVQEVQGSFCFTPPVYRKGFGNAGSYRKDTEASPGKQTWMRLPSSVNLKKIISLMSREVVVEINHHPWAIISLKFNTLK